MLRMNIKAIAKEKGMSLYQVYEKTDLPRYQTVVDIANNKKESINLKYLEGILKGLDMDISEMHKLFVQVDDNVKKTNDKLLEAV